jgi:hypothetical protein
MGTKDNRLRSSTVYPNCEACGKAPGRHTHRAENGETLQVCTACLIELVSD